MSRFLVTGATGFIGSAVVRRLAADGHDVLALRGRREPGFEHSNVGWRQMDLLGSSGEQIAAAFAGEDVTHCIHAAWYTHHADYLVHEVNREWVAASRRLADAFPGRFVGLGTCLEYDVGTAAGRLAEESPLRPETLYARCKLELFESLSQGGRDFAWARVFFVYGPGDREGRLIPGMIARFARGEAAGPACGGLRRDYVHVDDLAGQLMRTALSEVQGAINVGAGDAPTLSEIFEAGAHAFGRPELAQPNDRLGDQPPLIAADLSRFQQTVGEPQVRPVDEGLRALASSLR